MGKSPHKATDPSLPPGQAWGHWAPPWRQTGFRASHSLALGAQTSSRPQSPSVKWAVRGHGPGDPGFRPLKGEMKPVRSGGAARLRARTLRASQYGSGEWGRLLQAVRHWLFPRRGHVPHVPAWPAAASPEHHSFPPLSRSLPRWDPPCPAGSWTAGLTRWGEGGQWPGGAQGPSAPPLPSPPPGRRAEAGTPFQPWP